MAGMAIAELTIQERGILATSATAVYLDCFSSADGVSVSAFQQPVLLPRQRKYYSRGQTHTIEWQEYGQPLPAWFDPVMQGFVDLLTLPPDWDSYGAGAIDQGTVHARHELCQRDPWTGHARPAGRPLSSGDLQLEWHRQGIDLEVVFDQVDQPFFYY